MIAPPFSASGSWRIARFALRTCYENLNHFLNAMDQLAYLDARYSITRRLNSSTGMVPKMDFLPAMNLKPDFGQFNGHLSLRSDVLLRPISLDFQVRARTSSPTVKLYGLL